MAESFLSRIGRAGPGGGIAGVDLMTDPTSYLNPRLASQSQRPNSGRVDMRKVNQTMGGIMDLSEAHGLAHMPRQTPQEADAEAQALMSQYMVDPRSYAEILAEQEALYGEADREANKIQAYLALAKYGSEIASTPGSLLQALTRPLGDFATDLSGVAAQHAAQQRQLRDRAVSLSENEQAELRRSQFDVASQAMQDARTDRRTVDQTRANFAHQALGLAFDIEKDELAREQAQGLDWSKATPRSVLVPDDTTFSGYREQIGWDVGGQFFLGEGANKVPAPEGTLLGNERDMVQYSDQPDSAGRIFGVVRAGPNAGKKVLTTMYDPTTGQGTDLRPYVLEPGRWEVDEETGEERFSGNPLVVSKGRPEISFADMSESEIADHRRKITDIVGALHEAEAVLEAIPEAVGPLNTLKSLATNNIGMFSEEGTWEYLGTERARRTMELFGRTFARAAALSDRYATMEQQWSREYAENPQGFLKNKDAVMARFQELVRMLQNELAYSRSILGEEEYAYINPVPTGAKNDPFLFSEPGHLEYVALAKDSGAKLENRFIRLTAREAEAVGIDPGANRYIDIDLSTENLFD